MQSLRQPQSKAQDPINGKGEKENQGEATMAKKVSCRRQKQHDMKETHH